MSYSYKLHRQNMKRKTQNQGRYKKYELMKMTTYQLREICMREKLIKSSLNPLDKDELIHLIMHYRGIEESLFIQENSEEGQDRLQFFLDYTEKILQDDKIIRPPAKINIYEHLSVEVFDDYKMYAKEELDEGNILLIDERFQICTIFNLIKCKGEYYIVKDESIGCRESINKHYTLLYFERQQSELIYDIYYDNERHLPQYIKFYRLPLLDFSIKEFVQTDIPLAIDFGTTNTTAGIYLNKESFYLLEQNNVTKQDMQLDEISVVKVLDTSSKELDITPLIPSVVGIKTIVGDQVEYVFGYEAIRLSKLSYIDEGICLFYDIKRWVSDYDREEKVTDIYGQKRFVRRKEMIKAYLEYVIKVAKQRFKCNFKKIHISCPSKQKYKFYTLFTEILKSYIIEYENMLDEGVSVLFNTIADLIEKRRYQEGVKYKALIIDCGGGTTDLSSCHFSIENNQVSYQIEIDTAYENGDTDFGGNNLTYRLMEFLKILFAHKILKQNDAIKQQIIDEFDLDLFRYVDEHGIQEVYRILDEQYQAVEYIIPTQFKLYENKSSEDYFKVKSNFYLLFELAEQIKKEFFGSKNLLQVLISSEYRQEKHKKTILFDKWKLYKQIGQDFEQISEMPEISLSIYDVSLLIKADIYNIISKFLSKIYEEDKLLEYSIIKLTGQSCKVEIFREALKEFVPGRIIQYRQNKRTQEDMYDLKLTCLKGTLRYLQGKKFGYMNVNIHTVIPTLPYIISAYTHTGEALILIQSLSSNHLSGHVSRFMERIVLKLYLKDTAGTIRHEYEYENKPEDFERVVVEELVKDYPHVIYQADTDNIYENEVKFFVWAIPEEWGFCVLPVLRQQEQLYVGKKVFFNFENDIWETNFFDGLK